MWTDNSLDEKTSFDSTRSDLSEKDDSDSLKESLSDRTKEKTSSVTQKPPSGKETDADADADADERIKLQLLLSGWPCPTRKETDHPNRKGVGSSEKEDEGEDREGESDPTREDLEKMWSLSDLASLSEEMGSGKQALKVWKSAVEFGREKLGDHHPETILAIELLALSYNKESQPKNALVVLEALLRLRDEKGHDEGCEHDSQIDWAMHSLSHVYKDLGRLKDALKLSKKAVRYAKEKWGDRHEKTLKATVDLIYFDVECRNRLRGLMRLKKTLSMSREYLGEDNATTIWLVSDKAYLYSLFGRHDEEVKLQEQVLAKRVAQDGAESSSALRAMERLALARIYAERSPASEIIELCEKIIAAQEKRGGRDDDMRLSAMEILAYCCHHNKDAGENRKERAATLWKEILEARQRLSAAEDDKTRLAKLSLANVYSDSEDPDRKLIALQMREELAKSARNEFGLLSLKNLLAIDDLAESYNDCGRKKEAWALGIKYSPAYCLHLSLLFGKLLGQELAKAASRILEL